MDNLHNDQDNTLNEFDKWLKTNKVQPQPNLLARVRARLGESGRNVDDLLDELFQCDTRLRDPEMVRKVRRQIDASDRHENGTVVWFRWLAPLAAAATLTLAFVSFQTQAPEAPLSEGSAPGFTIIETPPSQLDSDVTRIFALAVNLQSDTDMTKLEAVETLAFLFD